MLEIGLLRLVIYIIEFILLILSIINSFFYIYITFEIKTIKSCSKILLLQLGFIVYLVIITRLILLPHILSDDPIYSDELEGFIQGVHSSAGNTFVSIIIVVLVERCIFVISTASSTVRRVHGMGFMIILCIVLPVSFFSPKNSHFFDKIAYKCCNERYISNKFSVDKLYNSIYLQPYLQD